jgi:hypothetical protein
MSITNTLKILSEQGKELGFKDIDLYLYIDKFSTEQILRETNKQILLGATPFNLDNNYMYRQYFHLMIILHIYYCCYTDRLNNPEYRNLFKKINYLNLMCGVFGQRNQKLYEQVKLYCSKLRPQVWAICENKTFIDMDMDAF